MVHCNANSANDNAARNCHKSDIVGQNHCYIHTNCMRQTKNLIVQRDPYRCLHNCDKPRNCDILC